MKVSDPGMTNVTSMLISSCLLRNLAPSIHFNCTASGSSQRPSSSRTFASAFELRSVLFAPIKARCEHPFFASKAFQPCLLVLAFTASLLSPSCAPSLLSSRSPLPCPPSPPFSTAVSRSQATPEHSPTVQRPCTLVLAPPSVASFVSQ